jgi:hypothetical protein
MTGRSRRARLSLALAATHVTLDWTKAPVTGLVGSNLPERSCRPISERAIRSGLRSEWPSQDTGPRRSGQSVDAVSDDHEMQLRSDSPEIVRVAGYHGLPGPLRTNGDVGIDDVGRPGACQQ